MDPREHALASFAGKNVRPSPLPLLVVCALGVLGASPPAPPPERFLAGVSFAMTNDRARGYDSERAGQSLSAQGVTAVSIMPFAFQREPAAARLTYRLTHAASELFTFFARRLDVKSNRTAIPVPRTAEAGRRINR